MSPKITTFTGDYRFLSNFFATEVVFNEIYFPTVEHAYQAAKSTSSHEMYQIADAATPGKAKKMGKEIKNKRPDWNHVKLAVMEDLLRQKFRKGSFNSKLLMETAPSKLEEGNTWDDTFWGINLRNGEGENHLGRLLMEIREELLNDH